MVRFVYCYNETKYNTQIENLITKFCRKHNIEYNIDTYKNGMDLLNTNLDFDIIFIEIQLTPDNGISIAKEIRKYNIECKIIFIANITDYYQHAFSVHAFGYITKPINQEDFIKLLHDSLIIYNTKSKISLKTSNGLLNIVPDEILYIEYAERKTHLYTTMGTYSSSMSLEHLYKKLQIYNFDYSHKSFLVNINQIKGIKGFDIELLNNNLVPLAQKKAAQFKRKYFKFLHTNR